MTYREVNTVFEAVDRLNERPEPRSSFERGASITLIARINGLMAGMTQGAAQTGTEPAGAEEIKTYLYDFTEVTFSIGDGAIPPDSLNSTKLNPAGMYGTSLFSTSSGTITQKICAVDFALVQRFAAGDIVTLTSVSHRAASIVNDSALVKYMVIVSEPKANGFLARLTAEHATIEGVYEWEGLTRDMEGTTATDRCATNLFELNKIGMNTALGTALYAGSNNWGHGQVLSGGGGLGTMTKNPLPTGGSGTGTIVIMHQDPAEHFWFYSVAPVTPACPA